MTVERTAEENGAPSRWDFHFATAALPERDRFEAWQDVSRTLVGVEAASNAPRRFDGEFAGRVLGPTTFVRSTSRASWYERTPALADLSDEISISFIGEAHAVRQPRADDLLVPSGGAVLFAHDRPFTLAQQAEEDTSFHFVLERKPLLELLPPGAPIAIRALDGSDGILPLIRGYVPTLATAESLAADTAVLVGGHLLDLVALLLRPSRDGRAAIEERGLKAARVKAILDLVARHHARPDLSADWIGARLGISARQVHRLVEESPKTLHEHILEARLQQALAMLSDPDGPALTVAEVARRSGFAATSHFCRSFKVRFGDTPTGVRAAATREAVADLSAGPH